MLCHSSGFEEPKRGKGQFFWIVQSRVENTNKNTGRTLDDKRENESARGFETTS
jgi:hypothetical protein